MQPRLSKTLRCALTQAENSRVERNAAHVLEPRDADAFEVAFQIAGESRAGLGD